MRKKTYNNKLRLGFDILRSMAGRNLGLTLEDHGVQTGNFQFMAPSKDGRPRSFHLKNGEEKAQLFNRLMMSCLFCPVTAGGEQIQAFSGSSALPDFDGSAAWTLFTRNRDYDLGYEKLFDVVDLNPNRLSFEIRVVDKGAQMRKVPEGGSVDIGGFSGTKMIVEVEKYGIGFGLTWETLQRNDFNRFKQDFLNYEAEVYGTWADALYSIIGASANDPSNSVVPYNNTGTSVLEKDINTINAAKTALLQQCKDVIPFSANVPLIIVADISMQERVNRALKSATNPYDNIQVNGNISAVFTMNEGIYRNGSNATQGPAEPIILIPGRYLQRALHTNNMAFTETQITSMSQIYTGWTAFGAGNGFVKQVKRFNLHP